jgi:hypothetical protein
MAGCISKIASRVTIAVAFAVLAFTGCGGPASIAPGPPNTTYVLTVASSSISRSTGVVGSDPAVVVTVTPADKGEQGSGTVEFYRTYDDQATVTLTAPQKSGIFQFQGWGGCNSVSGTTCQVLMTANRTVTAGYTTP